MPRMSLLRALLEVSDRSQRSRDPRSFAALDAGNPGQPVTRYDSARHRAAWWYQHRSDYVGYANAEHLGMRGEHDDESGNARHDGTG
jgi:hypothetical protein